MELWLPEHFAIDGASEGLLADIAEAARQIDQYRPLPADAVARIEEDLLGERVYSSNAIEGNTLDLRETVMVLKQGINAVKKNREAIEARNLGKAIEWAAQWIADSKSFHSVECLLWLHKKILEELDDTWAGRFREHQVLIQGAKLQPPDHTLVPSLVERVMRTLDIPGETNPVVISVWAHWALARIHPFHDGNGRLARLWQDMVFFRAGLTCAIIRHEDRQEYLDALGRADEGDLNPLLQLTSRRLLRTFDRYRAVLGELEAVTTWAAELGGETDARVSERKRLSYERWRRLMLRLRDDFVLCAAKLSERTTTLRVQVRPFEIIDQTAWENILFGQGAERTWFFTVEAASGANRKRYFFFFGRHFWTDQDSVKDKTEQRVSLLISEDDGTGKGVRLDLVPGCPITLREVFAVDDRLVRKGSQSGTDTFEYDRDISSLRVAQDFLSEVIQRGFTRT